MLVQLKSEIPTIRLIPINKKSGKKTQIILFSITFLTVFLTGYGITSGFFDLAGSASFLNIVLWSSIYTISFLLCLGIHEYGHMRSSRSSGVVINGPFFIPAPPIQLGFIGTLGAVISMRSLPPNRKELARIGISGPLFGFLAALLVGILGIYLSPLIPIEYSKQLIESEKASEIGFVPIIMSLLMKLRGVPPGYTLILHPLAFVSFIVFIVTFLNLLPVGQLDGGHVVRAYTSADIHNAIAYIVILSMFFIGLIFSGTMVGQYYMVLSFVLLFFKFVFGRKPHPGPANQLSESKTYSYLLLYILLIISTLPIPA